MQKGLQQTQNDQLRWAAHKKCIPVVRFDDLKKAVMLDGFLYSKKSRCSNALKKGVQGQEVLPQMFQCSPPSHH